MVPLAAPAPRRSGTSPASTWRRCGSWSSRTWPPWPDTVLAPQENARGAQAYQYLCVVGLIRRCARRVNLALCARGAAARRWPPPAGGGCVYARHDWRRWGEAEERGWLRATRAARPPLARAGAQPGRKSWKDPPPAGGVNTGGR